MSRPADYIVQGTTTDGRTVYYTGRAGDRFISENRADAFVGFYDTGAAYKAEVLNRMTAFHGVTFHAAPAVRFDPKITASDDAALRMQIQHPTFNDH